MSSYRFLEDHFVGGVFYQAGSTASTADVPGGTLPTGWVPSANVDPLDTAAVNAFYNQGPAPLGLVRRQWQSNDVALPVTFWQQTAGSVPAKWTLSGLGASKPAIFE
jgi:hypothetical protein